MERKEVGCVAVVDVVPCLLVRQKSTVSLQVDVRRDLIDCEVYNAPLYYVTFMCTALP